MTQTLPAETDIPARPSIPYTAASGTIYLLPETNAQLVFINGKADHISESTMAAVFPRILRGDAVAGIAHNPVTDLFEVREAGAIVFKGDSMMECRHAGYHFPEPDPQPLIDAVNESDRQDELTAPGLSTFEEPPTDDDDYHSTEPAVRAAAGKCFGAIARHGLSNDDQQMRLAAMEITGEFFTTRKQFTESTYQKLTREINNGAWECKPGCRTWLRVLFTENPQARETEQQQEAA